jgi:hypothetical protein
MVYVLLGLLAFSVFVNLILGVTLRNTIRSAVRSVRFARQQADDRVYEADARFDSLLKRIDTSPRLEVAPSTPDLPPLSADKPYLSDYEGEHAGLIEDDEPIEETS